MSAMSVNFASLHLQMLPVPLLIFPKTYGFQLTGLIFLFHSFLRHMLSPSLGVILCLLPGMIMLL